MEFREGGCTQALSRFKLKKSLAKGASVRSIVAAICCFAVPPVLWAQSGLPPCNKSHEVVTWSNCFGIAKWPGGQTYSGEFWAGKPHGWGILTFSDRRPQWEGFWEKGFLSREEPIPDEVARRTSSSDARHQSPVNPLAAGVEAAKGKCRELGFKPSTEKFGDCVLRFTR